MPKQVKVPTVGVVEFPEDFTDEQITEQIEAYRLRKREEATARGESSDWDALERANEKYEQDFYTLDEANKWLKKQTASEASSAKWWKRADVAAEIGQYGFGVLDISRHAEVAGQFAGAVGRDILESVTGKDYPLHSLVLEQAGWDNLEEFYKSGEVAHTPASGQAYGLRPGPFSRGLAAASGDKSLVEEYQRTLPSYPADIPTEQGGLGALPSGIAHGAEFLPTIALGSVFQRAGVPPWIAYGGVMGADTYGKTGDPKEAAKSGAMGAIIPSVGAGGRNMAGNMMAKLSEKAPMLANHATAHKAIESTISLGTIGVFMEGMNIQEYLRATPEKREWMIMHSIGSLIAFGPMEAAAVRGQPSLTQTKLSTSRPFAIAAANRGVKALFDSPEGRRAVRQMADDYAVNALDPNNARWSVVKALRTTPEGKQIEIKLDLAKKQPVVPLTEAEARDLKNINVDPFEKPEPKLSLRETVVRIDHLQRMQEKTSPKSEEGIRIAEEIKTLGDQADRMLGIETAPKVKLGAILGHLKSSQKEPAFGLGPEGADLQFKLLRTAHEWINEHPDLQKHLKGKKAEEYSLEQLRDFVEMEMGAETAPKVTEKAPKHIRAFEQSELGVEQVGEKDVRTWLSEDGYKFYEQPDGSWADKQGERAWGNLTEMVEANYPEGFEAGPRNLKKKREGSVEEFMEEPVVPESAEVKEARKLAEGKPPAADAPLASLPPGESTMPRRIKAPDISGKEPISIAEIRQYLSEALDIPIRVKSGAQYSGSALGVYFPKAETIRVNMINDLPTISHEVGHYLHYILFPGAKDAPMKPKASDFYKKYDHELFDLGKVTSRESYTKHQVRKEGVAEFFRHYLTDRAQAMAKAPDFLNYFEQALEHQHPEVWKIVNKAREDVGQYINQPAKSKVKSVIDFGEHKAEGKTMAERWELFKDAWVDELAPIRRAMDQLIDLPPDMDAYQLAINYTGGWRGKAEYTMERAQIDYNGKEMGESLRLVLKDVKNHEDFSTYLVAKRAVELNNRGLKTGIDMADAKEVVKDLEGNYGKSAERLHKFLHNELKLAEQAGFIDAKQRRAMEKKNEFYVPWHRVMETAGFTGKHGKGFVDLGKPVKGFKGGDQRIINPLESVIKNLYLFRDVSERNRVAKAFVDAVQGTRGGGRVAEKVGLKQKPTTVKPEEIERYLKDMGSEMTEIATGEVQDHIGFQIWRSYNPSSAGEQVFGVWRNGKQEFYQVEDASLYKALQMADSTHASLMNSKLAQGFLVHPTRLLRGGATLTPEFMLRNPFRDQVTAGIFSKHGYIPMVDGFRGMLSALGKDKLYWDWVKAGGRYADFLAGDRKDITRTLKDYSNEPQVKETIKKWGNPLTGLQKLSELMEVSTRISEFRRAKEAGLSDVAAANAAKDVTLNFGRHGYYGKVYNSISAFHNAKIQDISKFGRAQKERPVQTNLKAMLYVTTPSLLLWWLGKDDPEIQDLPPWRRALFWNMNLKPLAEKAGVEMDDFIVSFPKPFLLGTIYGTAPEAALDLAYKKDPNAIAKFYDDLERHSPLPIDPLRTVTTKKMRESVGLHLEEGGIVNWDNAPTVLKPIIENSVNYDFFRGRLLESHGIQNLPAELRMGPHTSEVAKLLGAKTGYSPIKIDNAVHKILAGLGRYGTDALDYALVHSQIVDIPTPPKKMLRERPLFRAFAQSPYAANRQVQEFYRGAELMDQRLAAMKQFGAHMGTKEQKDYFAKNKMEILFYMAPTELMGKETQMHKLITEGRSDLGTITRAMMFVQKNPKMSAEAKQKRLIKLSEKRNKYAKGLVKLLHPNDYKRVR